MTELLTAAQMRSLEAAAIASGKVTGLELMERAGRGVVEAIFEEWPELAAGSFRAVVLCGPGGNGGDGFVVARLLKEWGWEVEVFLYGDPAKMPPDARANYERWVGMGDITSRDLMSSNYLVSRFDLRIDAVFGTGLSRSLTGEAWDFCWEMFKCGPEVAIDVPSGFCADSGRFLGGQAKDWYDGPNTPLVVTFERAKLGHYIGLLPGVVEKLVVKSIGIGDFVPHYQRNHGDRGDISVVSLAVGRVRRAHEKDPAGLLNGAAIHKYTHGHALILSGGVGHGGAARLAARGALRIGAGVVTVGCPPSAVIENAAQLNAVMLRRVGDAEALAEVLEDRRINALCLGPGMGVSRAKEMLGAALQSRGEPRPTRAVVLDADALTALAEEPELFALLHNGCVLTPHGGEFARLFPDLASRLAEPAVRGPAYSKVDATREAATRAGCVVIFKGADTVIAEPSGRCCIDSAQYDRAAPWLATAGSGDVLAGFITGLLARGFSPMQAAETAAWLHVECARSFGPGLIAEDLPEELPKVFRALGI